MTRGPHLLVVGSLNLDLTVTVRRLPGPGQTVTGGDLHTSAGGKGANQAVAAARLGARTALLGLVGDDDPGALLRRAVAEGGVDTDGVRTDPHRPTGTALIVVEEAGGENTVTVAPGANDALLPDGLGTARALFRRARAVLLQLEIPRETVLAAAREARAAGALVALNAAPAPPHAADALREVLALSDLLVVNQGEAAALGAPGEAPPAAQAEALRALGPAEVVITLGADGAAGAGPDGGTSVPSYPVAAVDAVGAGDAFCAALVLARVEGRPLPEALRFACAAGALATTRTGAQRALPDRAAVDTLAGTPDPGEPGAADRSGPDGEPRRR